MKMRKVLAVLMLVVFVFAFTAGCGNNAGTDQSGDGQAAGGNETQQPEGDTVKIGVNFELTGDLASYGQSKLNGVKIALEEINAAGGVLGKQIELVEYDNKGDNAEAVNLATRLMGEDKVPVMMGPVTSGRVMAAINVAKQFQVPMVTGTGTSAGITVNEDGSVNDFVYRICFIDPYQGNLAANFAADSLGLKTAAMLVNQSDEYSIKMAEAFKETFTAKGGQVVAEESFMQGDMDFKAALTSIKSKNPEMIFVPNYYEPDALIAKQAKEVGYDGYLIGGDGWDNLDHLINTAGAEALQKTYFIGHYFSGDTDEKNVAFVEKYKALANSNPPSFAALGYDLMYFVKDAIERAGSLDPAAINTAMAETKGFSGITGTFDMGENHDPIKSAVVIGFDADGNYVLKEKVQ
ncbi:MAG: ABC transporter substrate-binding protein [Peptococcaceae bacterium]|nr:ABC transporter substrate-binding protein [Peptococcaceae bacterium]